MTWLAPENGTADFPTIGVNNAFDERNTFNNGFADFPPSTAFGEDFPQVANNGWEASTTTPAWPSSTFAEWPDLQNSTTPADFGDSHSGGWGGFSDFDNSGFENTAPGKRGSANRQPKKANRLKTHEQLSMPSQDRDESATQFEAPRAQANKFHAEVVERLSEVQKNETRERMPGTISGEIFEARAHVSRDNENSSEAVDDTSKVRLIEKKSHTPSRINIQPEIRDPMVIADDTRNLATMPPRSDFHQHRFVPDGASMVRSSPTASPAIKITTNNISPVPVMVGTRDPAIERRGLSEREVRKRVATLHDRVPALRRYASDLGDELNNLRAYAGRQSVVAEQCIEALHARAQELAAELIKVKAAGPVTAEAIRQREAVLREEARVLERRMESDRCGGTNGPTWERAEAEKRHELEARISGAKEREAAALETALKEMKKSEEKMAMLRVEKNELQARIKSNVSINWKSRFEAFVSAQQALADRAAMLSVDPGAARLDQALSAASAAAGAATGNHAVGCRRPPDHLIQAVKMLCGLAEAERRRGGLLVEKWRELNGNVPFTSTSSVPPVDQAFSPSPAYAWDLDMCRTPPK